MLPEIGGRPVSGDPGIGDIDDMGFKVTSVPGAQKKCWQPFLLEPKRNVTNTKSPLKRDGWLFVPTKWTQKPVTSKGLPITPFIGLKNP